VLRVKNGMRDGVLDGGFRVRGECESRGITKRLPLLYVAPNSTKGWGLYLFDRSVIGLVLLVLMVTPLHSPKGWRGLGKGGTNLASARASEQRPNVPQAVVINLRIDSEETRALGVEGLVCEVQLTLRAFVDILVALSCSHSH
jgi:hypothetical protein